MTISQSNQPKLICIAPYVANESETQIIVRYSYHCKIYAR